LPSEPALTTVEVMRDAAQFSGSLLKEPAERSMNGIFESMLTLAEAISAFAGTLVLIRMTNPGILNQPPEQWREKTVLPDRSGMRFVGYGTSAKSLENASALQSDQTFLTRMQAAAVLDSSGDDRSKWPGWLAASQTARLSKGDRKRLRAEAGKRKST
jgi:hypothetical protein